MSIQEDYTENSNEELLQMYGSTHSLEIKQELVMRYLYVVKSIALQMRDVYISFSQMEDCQRGRSCDHECDREV